jgi:AcrR family transcriptional regulator
MGEKRKYEMKARAERVAETRQRIVETTVALHREVGPRETTIAEIARRAGVERLTVYKHFPDDRALYAACQSHWLALVPPPDPAAHAALDPDERTNAVLRDLYRWYRAAAPMLRHVLGDAGSIPALADTIRASRSMLEQTVETLLRGRGLRGRARARTAAALGVVLQFSTWESLAAAGLADDEAATVAAAMARAG